jgi:hypothetical protein
MQPNKKMLDSSVILYSTLQVGRELAGKIEVNLCNCKLTRSWELQQRVSGRDRVLVPSSSASASVGGTLGVECQEELTRIPCCGRTEGCGYAEQTREGTSVWSKNGQVVVVTILFGGQSNPAPPRLLFALK